MTTVVVYVLAAVAEIAGCFAFWAVFRLDKSPAWLGAGFASLAIFAWLLTLSPAEAAGRSYAVYGGIYIVASLAWMWWVEGIRPIPSDLFGIALCLAGAAVILFGPRFV